MESITLDLIPNGIMPVLHASQYDISRSYHIDITELGTPYKLYGTETLTINERKGDNCICTLDVENTFANKTYIEFSSTEQMCAVWGSNLCELRIIKGGVDLGTLNFILEVEASPIEGGIQSESEINNLYTQIDARVDEDVEGKLDDYATKEWVGEECYDKTYIDNAFTGVNNSLNTKMDKTNPVGTGSFSFNRREGSTVGDKSVALGDRTIASGANSFTSGYGSVASGAKSTAMGSGNRASGSSSMAINSSNIASGDYSLAQGGLCEATEYCSHAEGYSSKASGYVSHAEGQGTIANHISQHASGEFNIPDDSSAPEYSRGKYVEIVGNGTGNNNRSNARTLDWDGNEIIAGDLTYNGNKSITGEVQRLDNRIDALPDAMIFKGTLGVGGTITELPTASANNEGWTYKVITAGTYAGQYADIGDCFTCYEASENVFGWTISSKGDTDTDTWRAIKVNGVEKLGNGISSGSLDVVDTDNIEAEFDNDGNKLKLKTKNIYTKTEVDSIVSDAIYNILPSELTPTGAIANFSTNLELPVIYEVENTATKVYQRGVNQFDKTAIINNYYINDNDGTQRYNVGDKCTDFIEVKPNTTYFIYSEQTSGRWGAWYDENKNYVSNITVYGARTSPASAKYARFTVIRQGNGNVDTFSVNYPSSETTSHAYNGKDYPILDHSDLPIIKAFSGINNLYADNGDVSAEYKVSIEDYVSRHSGGGLGGSLGGGLGGAKSGGSEEETDNTEDTEKTKLDETKVEVKEIGDDSNIKKLGGE